VAAAAVVGAVGSSDGSGAAAAVLRLHATLSRAAATIDGLELVAMAVAMPPDPGARSWAAPSNAAAAGALNSAVVDWLLSNAGSQLWQLSPEVLSTLAARSDSFAEVHSLRAEFGDAQSSSAFE
jgi:hypothetical protein